MKDVQKFFAIKLIPLHSLAHLCVVIEADFVEMDGIEDSPDYTLLIITESCEDELLSPVDLPCGIHLCGHAMQNHVVRQAGGAMCSRANVELMPSTAV